MCGICGKLDINGINDPRLIERMCESITHRGPDDHGVFVEGPIGIGSRRLAIIDLSPAGHMPMSTSDNKLQIVFNGEVYNYQEIKKQLQEYGYNFKSNTDTEVVLYAYYKWGSDCLKKFNGMFAFAIWDREKKQLFIARDRLGIKPFYYYYDNYRLIFASEIKAILEDSIVPRELRYEGVVNYFTFGHSMAPFTILNNINKLKPGHYLTCSIQCEEKLRIDINRYWQPPLPGSTDDKGEEYYAEEVDRLLRQSVRRRLMADVPLGVFLSGGLDSSIVTSLVCQVETSQVKTFSIGFNIDGGTYNETDDARIVAEHFSTDHHQFILNEDDLLDALPVFIYHYDEPFGDPAAFPTYLLSKYSRKYVTVVLSGEGGDEIFGGYRRYVLENLFNSYPLLTRLFNNPVADGLSSMFPRLNRLKRINNALDIKDKVQRYTSWLNIFSAGMRQELFLKNYIKSNTNGFDPLEVYRDLYRQSGVGNIGRLLFIDQQTWLPDTYLEKVDKASMAVSLEVRVPFLDHELLEFAATIPDKYKIRGFRTKRILKKAFSSYLPFQILKKRKHGFEVPLDHWLVNKLGDFTQDLLFSNKSKERGFFDPAYIRKIYNHHAEGKGVYDNQLWLLIVFELWCREFLDKIPTKR